MEGFTQNQKEWFICVCVNTNRSAESKVYYTKGVITGTVCHCD